MDKGQLIQTPSQTVGPYFAYGLTAEQYDYKFTQIGDGNLVRNEKIKGERIIVKGRVLDGAGNFIPDAMVEIWQADSQGHYAKSQGYFTGFGRQGTGTDKDGYFRFETIMPGSVNGAAPHVNVIVFMRGLLSHAYTRIYFPETAANENDEVLKSVTEIRRHTLIAQRSEKNATEYIFDIHMQGENETVFFDV